jgi:hypothetical protein
MSTLLPPNEAEWLEADGSGGFASGTRLGCSDPSLPRAACPGDHATGRSYGFGERVRGLGGTAGRSVGHFFATL